MQRIIAALLLAVTVTAAERTPGPVPDAALISERQLITVLEGVPKEE
ncbi:MAG TPA: hypothetical protein VIZ87_04210 [Terrimicrobium sp.]